MNNLSWLIYLADVADSIDWYLDATWFISLIILAIILLLGCAMAGDETEDFSPEQWKLWRRTATWLTIILGSATLLGGVVPAKETVYAIAASEMGEKLIKTDTANKALSGVNAWLDKQIAEEKEEAK